MRILYISQYFPPEVGATQIRAYEMATHLVRAGHHVTVLTEFPNHPKGIIPPEYHGRWVTQQTMEGVKVVRTWVYTRREKTFLTRIAFYLSFAATAIWVGWRLRGPFDVVLATSPPLFVGLAGWILSRFHRARFVFEVRDLWPESAIQLGELRHPLFIGFSERLEAFFYGHAAAIIAVTEGIRGTLIRRGLPAHRVHLITNGSNTTLFRDLGQGLKKDLGLSDHFVAVYAGIFGLAQGIAHLIDVVTRLKGNPKIHFVLIGEGPLKKQVCRWKTERGLDNLTILDEVPHEKIPAYLSMGDCGLVSLRKAGVLAGALPVKMFDTLACARPIVAAVEGEAQRFIEASKAGLVVPPEDVEAMAETIQWLADHPEEGKEMGRRGRAFVERHFSRQKKAQELEGILVTLVLKGSDP